MEVIIAEGHQQVPLTDDSYVGSFRRIVRDVGITAGLSSPALSNAEVVATEMATNVIKYAQGKGYGLVRRIYREGTAGIEIIVADNGPGMEPQSALIDGRSTAGTIGG